ncbi:MAG: hypothetical protein ABH823_02110 [bacterium]
MTQDATKNNNSVTIQGITFTTSGNIVFDDCPSAFHLAESPLLDKIDGILENGLQSLLKKLKASSAAE